MCGVYKALLSSDLPSMLVFIDHQEMADNVNLVKDMICLYVFLVCELIGCFFLAIRFLYVSGEQEVQKG